MFGIVGVKCKDRYGLHAGFIHSRQHWFSRSCLAQFGIAAPEKIESDRDQTQSRIVVSNVS